MRIFNTTITIKSYITTLRDKFSNHRYERLLNSNDDFTCILLSITVQDVATKGNSATLNGIFLMKIFNKNTHLK